MTDVALRDHLLALLEARDKAVALLASDLTRRLDQGYITFQGLETRLDRLVVATAQEQAKLRDTHHALAQVVAGILSRHDREAGSVGAWSAIGAYVVGIAGIVLAVVSLLR